MTNDLQRAAGWGLRRAVLRLASAGGDPPEPGGGDRISNTPSRRRRQDQEAITLWAPAIDPVRCSHCPVSTRFCNSGSLTSFNAGAEKIAINVDPTARAGCGLCMDVCDDEAISVVILDLCAVRQMDFHARDRGGCRAIYHRPARQREPQWDMSSVCAVHPRHVNCWQVGA